MSFREPLLLLALVFLPLAIAAYVLAQRRRKKFALRYTNIPVLATVAGRSWGRHVPAAFALLALGVLLFALSRPERTVAAPQRQGSVWDCRSIALTTPAIPLQVLWARGGGPRSPTT